MGDIPHIIADAHEAYLFSVSSMDTLKTIKHVRAPKIAFTRLTLKATFPKGMNVTNLPRIIYSGYPGGCAEPSEKEAAAKRLLSPT